MARQAAVLQRQGDDVGRLVRGIRPMDSAEGVPAAPGYDCSGSGGASRRGFPFSIQHFRPLRYAMADFYQRGDKQRKSFWEQQLLEREGARDVYDTRGVPKL